MREIVISGPWSWLDPIMSDPNHESGLHVQINKLGLLTRIYLENDVFSAKIFSGGMRVFLDAYTIESCLALSQSGVSFEGYPCWITATSGDLEVPNEWPASTNVDGEGNSTPKTFEQWCSSQNHTMYEDNGSVFAGNFKKHGWGFTASVPSFAGFGLLNESDAKDKIEALNPVEV